MMGKAVVRVEQGEVVCRSGGRRLKCFLRPAGKSDISSIVAGKRREYAVVAPRCY